MILYTLSLDILYKPSQLYNDQYARLKESSAWVQAQIGQTKDYEIDICCFPTKNEDLGVRAKTGGL